MQSVGVFGMGRFNFVEQYESAVFPIQNDFPNVEAKDVIKFVHAKKISTRDLVQIVEKTTATGNLKHFETQDVDYIYDCSVTYHKMLYFELICMQNQYQNIKHLKYVFFYTVHTLDFKMFLFFGFHFLLHSEKRLLCV